MSKPAGQVSGVQRVQELLSSRADQVGVFEEVVGLDTATTTIKAVHLMNDLAQQLLGGAPKHRGDLLCRVIRPDHVGEEGDEEDNSDLALRQDPVFGESYRRAFPPALGVRRTAGLRTAIQVLLNSDKGMYRAGTSMASGLATHRSLLGFEGFSRFGLGSALSQMLGETGRARVRQLFESTNDPVSRALRPIMLDSDLVPRSSGRSRLSLTDFDRSFGRRLSNLLEHPLSKPTALRSLALAGTMWLVLRVLGAGRAGGRPLVLALPFGWREQGVRLREEAVQTFSLSVDALDRKLGQVLEARPGFPSVSGPEGSESELDESLASEHSGYAVLSHLRRSKKVSKGTYWPDDFAVALGRKAGLVWPRSDRFGWGRYICLTGDLLEVLLLMFSEPGGEAQPWRSLWTQVASELGLVVGANPYEDALLLGSAGCSHIPFDRLSLSAEVLLDKATTRGLARRLPDGDAEVGANLL